MIGAVYAPTLVLNALIAKHLVALNTTTNQLPNTLLLSTPMTEELRFKEDWTSAEVG